MKINRDFEFRVIHLAMILAVVFEALSGITCLLTVWKYEFRLAAGQPEDNKMIDTFRKQILIQH